MTTLNESEISLQRRLNYTFKNPQLLHKALTHRSFANEANEVEHNERLEFLGDAVIDLSLSDLLMKTYPELREGDLSKIRASLVNETFLTERAIELDIPSQMRLGKGELKSGGAEKPRLISSVLEALFGAIYLESGYDICHEILKEIFGPHIQNQEAIEDLSNDYKTQLQEITQRLYKKVPRYKVESEDGPDHNKTFEVSLCLDGQEFSRGNGKSKKMAEQVAAKEALNLIQCGAKAQHREW